MKKNIRILALAIFTLFIAGDIFSQPPWFMGGRGRGHAPMHPWHRDMCFGDIKIMKEALKLSDKQIEQVSRINNEFCNTMKQLDEKMGPLQLQLRGLLLGEINNLNQVRSILKQISEIEVEMRMARIQHRIAIEKVLTKDQIYLLKSERRIMRNNPEDSPKNESE